MIGGDDLEEIWERAITVARMEHPNRYSAHMHNALTPEEGMYAVLYSERQPIRSGQT